MLTAKENSLNVNLTEKNKKKILINNIIEEKIKKKENIFEEDDINICDNKHKYSDDELAFNDYDSYKLEYEVNKSNSNKSNSNKSNLKKKNSNKNKLNIIDNKYDDEYNDDEDIELEKLEKEFTIKSGYNSSSHPKNYGNIWNDEDRNKIKKYLLKNKFDKNYGMFDESNIFDIAKKLQRSEYGVKEEIKKMIYNEYIKGFSYDKISENFNIPANNIKLIIKVYIDKYGKNIINQIEFENKLLRLKVENIKLKKELEELNK